jgi:hypothetical protein
MGIDCDAVVDLGRCRYPIVHAVATDELMWDSAVEPGSSLPTAASGGVVVAPKKALPKPTAAKVTSGGAGQQQRRRRVPLVVWSDLSVTSQRLLALQHALPHAPWASCVFVNHFPGMGELCRKTRMAANLGRMAAAYPSAFTFLPATWNSFDEYTAWCRAHANDRRVPCIVKPSAGCMGKGIVVAHKGAPRLWSPSSPLVSGVGPVSAAAAGSPGREAVSGDVVIQQYVADPLLIDGRKFDLRCYVAVTSVDPWRVYFFKDGLVRLCTRRFEAPGPENEGTAEMHLTNFAINRAPGPAGSPTAKSDQQAPPPGTRPAAAREDPASASPAVVSDLSCAASSCALSCGAKMGFGYLNANLLAVCEERELVARGVLRPHDDLAVRRMAERDDYEVGRYCCGYHRAVSVALDEKRRAVQSLDPTVRSRIRAAAEARVARVWDEVHLLALNSLWGVLPRVEDALRSATLSGGGARRGGVGQVRCFEVLGYDVLLDRELRPWLVEVNHSPSWAVSSPEDEDVKRRVLSGVLRALTVSRHTLPVAAQPNSGSRLGSARRRRTPSNKATAPSSGAFASSRESLGTSGRGSSVRRHRDALMLPASEYHALVGAYETEALGEDFVRLFPPPERARVEMLPGGTEPRTLTPYERRALADRRAGKGAQPPGDSDDASDPATPHDADPVDTHFRTQWSECMDIYAAQRDASRIALPPQ